MVNLRNYIIYLFLLLWLLSNKSYAQFNPQVGKVGCNAIHKDSSIIQNWIKKVNSFQIGFQQIGDSSLGYAASGVPENVFGNADHLTFSLGDGGWIVLEIGGFLYNGEGPDFVVFENGFSFGLDSNFLELAFVEVSNDGINFYRFPAQSLSDTINQIGPFGSIDASKVNNLAGKYVGAFGTPFNLDDLKSHSNLNLSQIKYIRLVDVIGSLEQEFSNKDINGRKINDPWPTPFASSGFDLDAIGIINGFGLSGMNELKNSTLNFYPNSVRIGEMVEFKGFEPIQSLSVTNSLGESVFETTNFTENFNNQLVLPNSSGIYFVYATIGSTKLTSKILVQP